MMLGTAVNPGGPAPATQFDYNDAGNRMEATDPPALQNGVKSLPDLAQTRSFQAVFI